MRSWLTWLIVTMMLSVGMVARAEVKIVSTIPDFGAIAKEVGGEHVSVTSMVRPTQDPHYVDAKPSLMIELNKADMLLVAGMDLEAGWLPPLMTGARNGNVQRGGSGYLDCSTLIPPMQVRSPDRSQGDIHPGGNPHYWTDPRNGVRLARGIAQRLAKIDPDNADAYKAGADAFVRRLEGKMAEWRKRLEPHKGTKVVVYHESWVYFLDFVGFVQAGELEPKPGIPPKPAHVAELIQRVQGQGIKYVVQESFYPTQLSRIFAQKSGAELKVLPTMVGAAGTSSYVQLIDRLVAELTN
ncbi:MAG TPA: metal ABC transporter substrate-binding protein [Polyangiaceae bacterium]|jgi:zinc/manganese transport system substrate-binding protein|nr:MAG: Manganese ABC transporter substrate-binding lipoprotein precursor [Deltaproteobacteria bacterium ADurb.Bin207]HNS97419.1 metal ABC transporter substrate-binding protein [Polyangiaceae bacterium]HNZ21877.1 metal ABC transporter substrate-binding protein [Polyangiaceae bacterium]HOD23208.1 metal ABC transporter substrate-binding protein [Polyangiaceae bacterium]HOE52000.1 metal ABC transporter substrate-binding protein [Polyangiaceae bacterium]